MPPRFVYWTIVIDGQPTAFRAATREELLPTLRQIASRNPGTVMKWFAQGRLWDSPADAAAARERRRSQAQRRPTHHAGEKAGPGRHKGPRARSREPRIWLKGPHTEAPSTRGLSTGPKGARPERKELRTGTEELGTEPRTKTKDEAPE